MSGYASCFRSTQQFTQQSMRCFVSTCDPKVEILIVGAGTGAEILELGKTNPGWRFVGVDPAKAMLDLAKEKIETVGLY